MKARIPQDGKRVLGPGRRQRAGPLAAVEGGKVDGCQSQRWACGFGGEKRLEVGSAGFYFLFE